MKHIPLLRTVLFGCTLLTFALVLTSFSSNNTSTSPPTLVDYYWVGGGGDWTDATGHWATTSGGNIFHLFPPTINDNVIFDANSGFMPGDVVEVDALAIFCSNMNWMGVTNTPEFRNQLGATLEVGGSLSFSPNMINNFLGDVYFVSNTAGQELTASGLSFLANLIFDGSGSWEFQDDFSTDGDVFFMDGTLSTNGHQLDATKFISFDNGGSRTLMLGNSTLNLGTQFEITGPTSITIDAGTSSINLFQPAAEFDVAQGAFHQVVFLDRGILTGGGNIFQSVEFKSTGDILGSHIYENLIFAAGENYTLEAGAIQTIDASGMLTATGNSSNPIYIASSVNGSSAFFQKNGASVCSDYLELTDVSPLGNATFYAGSNSNNVANSAGWYFIACPCLPAPMLDVNNSITEGCDGQTALLILDGLTSGQEAVWYDDPFLQNEIYRSTDNEFAPAISIATTYYGLIYDTGMGCNSDFIAVNIDVVQTINVIQLNTYCINNQQFIEFLVTGDHAFYELQNNGSGTLSTNLVPDGETFILYELDDNDAWEVVVEDPVEPGCSETVSGVVGTCGSAAVFICLNSENLSNNSFSDADINCFEPGITTWLTDDGVDTDYFYFDGIAVQQLTNDNNFDDEIQISNGNAVWTSNGQIFWKDLNSSNPAIQISDNAFNNHSPRIDGNTVVWIADNEIHLYGIGTGDPALSVYTSSYFIADLQFENNHVVWRDSDGTTDQIFLLDIFNLGSPTNISNNAFDNSNPQFAGEFVVWNVDDFNDLEIFIYDLINGGPAVNLSNNNGMDTNFDFSYTHLVWERDMEIMLYDFINGGAPTMISTPGLISTDPQISGNNIVFVSNGDLVHYDISLGASDFVAQGLVLLDFYLEGDFVVWSYWDGSDSEIFFHDLTGGIDEFQVTNNTSLDSEPKVFGDQIFWLEGTGATSEVYFLTVEDVPEKPILDMSNSVIDVCLGNVGIVQISNLGPNEEVIWYDDMNLTNIIYQSVDNNFGFLPLATFTMYGTKRNFITGCESDTLELEIVVRTAPDISTMDVVEFCSGTNFDLTTLNITETNSLSGTTTYHSDSPATTANELSSSVVTPMTSTSYFVLFTLPNGCFDELEIPITVNTTPVLTLNEMPTLCMGDFMELTDIEIEEQTGVMGTLTFHSATPTSGANKLLSTTVAPMTTTTYYARFETADGCFTELSFTVEVRPIPDISTMDMPVICRGESFDLSGVTVMDANMTNGTITYHFATPAFNNNQLINTVVNPQMTTTYYILSTTADGCRDETSVTVTVMNAPDLSTNEMPEICDGESYDLSTLNFINLGLPGDTTYHFASPAMPGNELVSPVVSPNLTDTYYILVTGANGCSDELPVTVTVNPLPNTTVTTNMPVICLGNSFDLSSLTIVDLNNPDAFITYHNGTPANGSNEISPIVTPTVTTNYYILATNIFGCAIEIPINLTVNPAPQISTNDMPVICEGESFNLASVNIINGTTSSGVLTYHSDTPATPANELPTPIVMPTTATTYYILSTSPLGCSDETSVTVEVMDHPEIIINDIPDICPGSSFDLTTLSIVEVNGVNVNLSYHSNTPATSGNELPSPIVSPTVPTTYYVLATTVTGGCTDELAVTLSVQDVTPPIVTCPANISVHCTDDLTDPTLTGTANAFDNCNTVSTSYVDVELLNECGVGQVLRIWIAEDAAGNKDSCQQTITVTNFFPFTINDIIFPQNYEASDCTAGLLPDDLPQGFDYPIITPNDCDMVDVTFEDIINPNPTSGCYEILRSWTVINTCIYNENDPNSPGIFQSVQSISVNESTPPQITSLCNNIEVCNSSNNCADQTVVLMLEAMDDCTESDDLVITYSIDLDSDGSINMTGTGSDATNNYPLGIHQIDWEVADLCGNITTCTQTFQINDCVPPNANCPLAPIQIIMPSPGVLELVARDLDFGASSDNCSAYEDLRFAFSQDINDTIRILDCDDVATTVTLGLWVYDEAGNSDICVIDIVILDPNDVCHGPMLIGNIRTENLEGVGQVEVEIFDGNITTTDVTGPDGLYIYTNFDPTATYTITPSKNINILNGVTTFDAVLITRHILGIEPLPTPYKIIAADINANGQVTTFDIVLLRSVILQMNPGFPDNESWRFVREDYIFQDPLDPLEENFPEAIGPTIINVPMNLNFVGIKIGDVNDSANPDLLIGDDADTRDFARDMEIHLKDQFLEKNEVARIDFTAKDFKTYGFQFSLNYDETAFEIVKIVSENTLLKKENIGQPTFYNNMLTVSWNDSQIKELPDDAILFSLEIKTKREGYLSEMGLAIHSDLIAAEGYGEGFELLRPTLIFDESKIISPTFELFQNTPNPFSETTQIGFVLPEASQIEFRIFDTQGKTILVRNQFFEKGKQIILLNEKLPKGVLYYQLKAGANQAIRKMIVLE